jgi:DNA-binding response OmpR family regulator
MWTVLLVEDDILLGSSVKELLEGHNFSVNWVKNGKDAFALLKANTPDIIISDLTMPIVDGTELLLRVRSLEAFDEVPFIVLTANPLYEKKIEILENGVNDYLIKPFSIKELILRIENLLSYKEKLKRHYTNNPFATLKLNVSGKSLLEKVDEFIVGNMKRDFSVDEIAQYCNVSRSTLDKKIRLLTKKNITRYVREYRLETALYLIHKGTTNIKSLGIETGFNSMSYFSISFRNYKGVSPIEYIKSKEPFKG